MCIAAHMPISTCIGRYQTCIAAAIEKDGYTALARFAWDDDVARCSDGGLSVVDLLHCPADRPAQGHQPKP